MKVKAKSNEVESKIGEKPEGKCPVCGEVFLLSVATAAVNEHINHCLDKSSKVTDGENESGRKGGANLHSELVAHALNFREKEIIREEEETEEMFFCQICQKDLTRMNSQRRQQHMNSCCDKAAEIERSDRRHATGTGSVGQETTMNHLTCPLCHKQFKSDKTQQTHIKKCAQKSNVSINEVLQLVHNQAQHLTTAPASAGVTQNQERASNQAASVAVTTRRRRKQISSKKNLDEETQLAMALSASMAPPPEPKTKKSGRGARRKNKQVDVVPALCLRSEEEMKQVIATRAAQVICPQEVDDEEISSTPALPPSKLVKQLNSHSFKNPPTDSSRGNSNMTENNGGQHKHLNKSISETTTTRCDSDNEEVSKAKDTAHVGGNSDGLAGEQYPVKSQLFRSDLWGTSFNSKSFLSFLHDDDEVEMIEPAPSKLNAPSCTLWSLTGLPADKSALDFYVPGLLPQQPKLKDKKALTPTKGTVERVNTVSTAIQNSDGVMGVNEATKTPVRPGNKSPAAEDVDITSVIHSRGCSADQLTASQMVNVEMLAELASSGGCSETTMATQRLGSVNDGDDSEVFPSSGFCVPVVRDIERKKECEYCRGTSSQLVQDLSTMICNPLFSDVTIVAENNQTFPAHKVILATRCKELSELLINTSTTDEYGNCWLHLKEITPEVLSIVFKYLYTGVIDFPQELKESVKLVAERLQLTEIEDACSNVVQKEIDNYGQLGEMEVVHQSPDLNKLVNKVLDDSADSTDKTINHFGELLNQDEPGFDEEDIEEIRIFQTQVVKEKATKEGSSGGIMGVLDTMEGTVIDRTGENFDACEENLDQFEEVNYYQDSDTRNSQSRLSEKVSVEKRGENDDLAISEQSETNETGVRLCKDNKVMLGTAKLGDASLCNVSDATNSDSNCIKIRSPALEKDSDPGSDKTDEVHSVNTVNNENFKPTNRLFPAAVLSENENDRTGSGAAPSYSVNCELVTSENDDPYYQFSDQEQQISFTDTDLETVEPDKMDTGVLGLEQMSDDEDISLNPAKMCSNERGSADKEDFANVENDRIDLGSIDSEQTSVSELASPVLQMVNPDRQWLGDQKEDADVETVKMKQMETGARNVEQPPVGEHASPSHPEVCPNEQRLEDVDEDYEDQAFGYQDLPSPPVAESEGKSDDVHSNSDGEDALCQAHDESICLLSGNDSDIDKSLDEVEVRVVPETPSTARKPPSLKQHQQNSNQEMEKESSPARHFAGDDCELSSANNPDLLSVTWNASLKHSGDKEVNDFLAKLKNRADKGNKKNKKRKRGCSLTRARPAKRQAGEETDRISGYPQNQSKSSSLEGFSCSEDEQEFQNKPDAIVIPAVFSKPVEEHCTSFSHCSPQRGLPSSSPPSHTLQTEFISRSSSPRSHSSTDLTFPSTSCVTLRGKVNKGSSQSACFPAASSKFQFSHVHSDYKPGGSNSNDFDTPVVTPTQIKKVDESINLTFQTPDISVISPSFISPPVPSFMSTHSFTQLDSPENSEVPVTTPPGNAMTRMSKEIVELDVPPTEPASDAVFTPLHPPPGSPEVSEVDTAHFISTPHRKVYQIASQEQEESSLSPSVPLGDYSQLSRNRDKRTTAKSLSFSGSRSSKYNSTLIESSGDESSCSEVLDEETGSRTLDCRSDTSKCLNSEERTHIVNSSKEHTDESKETRSKHSRLGKESSIDVNVGLFQRLRAGKYGLNRGFESDHDSDSVDSEGDDGMRDRQVSDGAAAEQSHEGVVLSDGVTVGDSHYVNDDDFFYEDGGYNCDNEFEACYDQTSDDDMLDANTEKVEQSQNKEFQSEKTPTSVTVKNSNITNREGVSTAIHAQTSAKSLPSRETVAKSVGQARKKGAKQAGKSLGGGSKVSAGKDRAVNRNVAKIPVTPMADYDNMATPELKNELRSYGVRQLPKKKMVTKLKEIYHYTHQEPGADENIFEGPPPKAQAPKVSGVPRSQKRACGVQNQVQDSSSESEMESGSSRVQENSQGTGTETGTASSGDESEEFGDVTMEIEGPGDDVTPSQQMSGANLQERLRQFITTSKELYIQVLKYKPLDLVAVHQRIKASGIACSLGKLVDFLDLQGITFSTASTRPGGSRTRRKFKKNNQARKNAKNKR